MPVRGAAFYAANAVRRYPLDDLATAAADSGAPLPDGILVDCVLRLPATLGRRACLAAATVSPRLVTVLVSACDDADDPAPRPAAALSLVRPAVPGRHYPLRALAGGVAGWVVLGDQIDEPYTGRFSTPRQGLLLARCARAYRTPPVPSLAKAGSAEALAGTVTLKTERDLAVAVETITLDRLDGLGPRPTTAAVFRLANAQGRDDLFGLYAGPCGGRPESGTCGKPALERVGPAVPDCDGNVTIDFRNVATTPAPGGVVLDFARGLPSLCPPDRLPAADGRLPGAADDLCQAGAVPADDLDCGDASGCVTVYDDMQKLPVSPDGVWQSQVAPGIVGTYDPGTWSVGLEATPTVDPPYVGGAFQLVKLANSREKTSVDFYRPACEIAGEDVYGHAVETLVRPWAGGAESNGGVLVDFIQTGNQTLYYLLLVNVAAQALEAWRLRLFDHDPVEANLELVGSTPADGTWARGAWFKVHAAIPPAVGEAGVIAITATPITQAADCPPVTLEVPFDLAAINGAFGVGAMRSRASFAYFLLQRSP